jgi:hypothetical protein
MPCCSSRSSLASLASLASHAPLASLASLAYLAYLTSLASLVYIASLAFLAPHDRFVYSRTSTITKCYKKHTKRRARRGCDCASLCKSDATYTHGAGAGNSAHASGSFSLLCRLSPPVSRLPLPASRLSPFCAPRSLRSHLTSPTRCAESRPLVWSCSWQQVQGALRACLSKAEKEAHSHYA